MRSTNCRIRPPLSSVVLGSWNAFVILPKLVELAGAVFTEVDAEPGKKKLTLLNAFNASARISMLTRSVILVFLDTLMSAR